MSHWILPLSGGYVLRFCPWFGRPASAFWRVCQSCFIYFVTRLSYADRHSSNMHGCLLLWIPVCKWTTILFLCIHTSIVVLCKRRKRWSCVRVSKQLLCCYHSVTPWLFYCFATNSWCLNWYVDPYHWPPGWCPHHASCWPSHLPKPERMIPCIISA